MSAPTDRADEYWAGVFGVETRELRRPGLHTTYVDDPGAGIYVLSLGGTVRVRAPSLRRPEVEEISHDVALDPRAWREVLGDASPVVLGPAAHYLGSASVAPTIAEVHPDPAEVLRMVERIEPEEVEESGVVEPDAIRFGLWHGKTLVAVSALGGWVGGHTDVGLLVAPEVRGLGLGRAVASVALSAATREAGIARWRCREDNAASVALAGSLGLQRYGRNLGIRLPQIQ
ncbi:hypothetical protein KNO15_14885 [Leifsonia shinshuensis]|uniref:GNAT family N-acetyltransferase n=1 Tax=Leifsonia shinshuensis TaxID=150026 RepID=UPI001F508FB0|nr:GNAT family N-acetyltransferase [Leifsonia shinshuensis]MCI0157983.1 hypothetical protein [Leifsonia shinshuensis]